MKESENAAQMREGLSFTADETERLMFISDIVENDALRYERLLDAEEEYDEL